VEEESKPNSRKEEAKSVNGKKKADNEVSTQDDEETTSMQVSNLL
jgi:hypothetical protein